jgi:nucleoside-diphosphate-sugar epimerase
MIAVVTGSSGFIGSRLADALAWRGWSVRRLARAGASRAREGAAAKSSGAPSPLGTIETYTVDYARPETLAESPALADADIVFHVGGVTKARSDEEFRAGNVAPTRALLDAVAARMTAPGGKRPRRFVLVSSQAAAGPAPSRERPVTEDDEPRPFEAYGRSKLEAETLVRERAGGVPWTIVRPSAVYGPGDTDFLALFRQASRGLGVYPGPREARLSIVYVDDLVDALIRAGTVPAAAGRTYFIESEAVCWRDVYRAAADAARQSLHVELDLPHWLLSMAGRAGDAAWRLTGRAMLVNSQKIALGTPQWWLCDGTRAREELGVVSRVSLNDGAKRTLRWYREKGLL